MEAANTKRGIDLERAASDAYHDCEELLWRLRWALKASDEPEDPATT